MKRILTGPGAPKPAHPGLVLSIEPRRASGADPAIARAVREGLTSRPKWLPPWLFYDAEGSRLFEKITALPEYYLTRSEIEILTAHGGRIVYEALQGTRQPPLFSIMELGAGTAAKSTILLEPAITRLRAWDGHCLFVPVDISETALVAARARLASALPDLVVRTLVGNHEAACAALRELPPPRMVLFLGSSMGNFEDAANISLFRSVRDSLDPGDTFVVGADRQNPIEDLLAAYDDPAGVTAAFNRNILTRINRELGGRFDPSAFAHVVRWNAAESRVEMHLESRRDQQVRIQDPGITVSFARGETIHTESSVKYTDDRIKGILAAAGLVHERAFFDSRERFGLHLSRAPW